MKKTLLTTLLLGLGLGLGAGAVLAHTEEGAVGNEILSRLPAPVKKTPPIPQNEAQSREYFTDLPLVTQDGQEVRFYTDVLKGRVVVIDFVYTNCVDACPLLTQKLKGVREALGERFGTEVFFVSISIDPEQDTPEALTEFAEKQGVNVPGWVFLTGKKENVEHIVRKLGQWNSEVEQHSTLLLAGNVKTRHWSKIPPMSSTLEIALKLEQFAAEL